MIRLRKDTKFVIILVVVLISIYLGYERSGVGKAFFYQPEKMNTKEADKLFQNLGNTRKVILEYNVSDKAAVNQQINEIIFSQNANIKYTNAKETYVLNILEFPAEKFAEIMMQLRSIEGLKVENIQTEVNVAVDKSINASINNNEMTKKRIQELINKTTSSESIKRLKQELEETQAKIDSLNNLVSATSHFNDHDLFFISIISNPNTSSLLKKTSLEFVLTSFVIMVILIIALIIFYFIYIGSSALMRVMGIRTSRAGSSNYNTYSYGKRSYGRKVKRIYKNPDGTRRVEKEK